jgi:signal transduction histidine kinase
MMDKNHFRSGVAAFEPRARLLRLIGAELISDEVVAITELVKNAHDADAGMVSVQFVAATAADGEILVRDDGHGMDVDTLLTRWMQPAGSSKGRAGTRHTATGRRVLGEKGVGRFAADKLASRLELVSRQPGKPGELHAVFDWDDYDVDGRMLSDVRSRWSVRQPEWLESQGTLLRLTGLRTRWTERMFRKLSTRLSRLISPFRGDTGFRIVIESDEFPQYSGEVAGFLDKAPYSVEARLGVNGDIELEMNGGPVVRYPWPGGGAPSCGAVRARLFAFDLETEALAKVGPRMEVRAWLREWSGVSVYRDGFRVWPYGEPHDDWLRLDQRRVNNPVMRLSNNQIVGFVEVTADANPELRDQTNREGLIHNGAFEDLQHFILYSMQMLEAERQSIRHPSGTRKDRRLARSGTSDDLAELPARLENIARDLPDAAADALRRTAEKVRAEIGAHEAARRRMIEGYTDLAAAGHTAALFGRGLQRELELMRDETVTLRSGFGKKDAPDPLETVLKLAALEKGLAQAIDRISVVAQAGSGGSSKRRRGIDIVTELQRVASALDSQLAEVGGSMSVQGAPGEVLRAEMRPDSFAAIFHALARNSIEWAQDSKPLRIVAEVRNVGDDVEVLISDNGKGVVRALESSLFEPMISGREDGAGMGLTLARSIATSHGGSLSLVVDRRRRGATFMLRLPRKKSRATAG